MRAVLAIALALNIAVPAAAVTIMAEQTEGMISVKKCAGLDGAKFKDCTTTKRVDAKTSLDGKNADFAKAFAAWNDALPMDSKWTLSDGGALPGGDFTVLKNNFRIFAGGKLGGYLAFQVDWSYKGNDKRDFVWTSGLYDNYVVKPPKLLEQAVYEIDNRGSKTSPAYPFQKEDRYFFDKPNGYWPNASFDAWTFLSKVDTAKRSLTVYEGINWGFSLNATPADVPEPATWLTLIAGFGLTGSLARRQRARAAARGRGPASRAAPRC